MHTLISRILPSVRIVHLRIAFIGILTVAASSFSLLLAANNASSSKKEAVEKTTVKKKVVPAEEMKKVAKECEMKAYRQKLKDTEVSFEMVPIPGGVFTMGSPESEEDRGDDEGPQHEVKIEPFWMGKCEVTWDEYQVWATCRDKQLRKYNKRTADAHDKMVDAISRPTPEFRNMDFDMGRDDGFPAICITQFAAQCIANTSLQKRAITTGCLPKRNGNMLVEREQKLPTLGGMILKKHLNSLGLKSTHVTMKMRGRL